MIATSTRPSPSRTNSVAPRASMASGFSYPRRLGLFIRRRAMNRSPRFPFASTSARIVRPFRRRENQRFESRRLVPRLRARRKENSTEESDEIPIDDRGGLGIRRHSERDFAFG